MAASSSLNANIKKLQEHIGRLTADQQRNISERDKIQSNPAMRFIRRGDLARFVSQIDGRGRAIEQFNKELADKLKTAKNAADAQMKAANAQKQAASAQQQAANAQKQAANVAKRPNTPTNIGGLQRRPNTTTQKNAQRQANVAQQQAANAQKQAANAQKQAANAAVSAKRIDELQKMLSQQQKALEEAGKKVAMPADAVAIPIRMATGIKTTLEAMAKDLGNIIAPAPAALKGGRRTRRRSRSSRH